MKETDEPINRDGEKVKRGKHDDKCFVGNFGRFLLFLLSTAGKSHIVEENSIRHHSSNNEQIVDEDPSRESSDTDSNRGARCNRGYQKSC